MTRANTTPAKRAKRPDGTGNVTHTCGPDCTGGSGNHRWKLRFSGGWDPDARRYTRISRSFVGTKAEAERELQRISGEIQIGTIRAPLQAHTLEAALANYANSRKLSPRTRQEVQRIARTHLAPLGPLPLSQITPAKIDRLLRDLEAKGLAPATVHRIYSVLRAAISWAVRWDWISNNPAKRVDPPRIPRQRNVGRVDSSTVRMLLERARQENHDLGVVATFAALTGMRRGEICALRWQDIDLERGVIHVAHSLMELGRKGRKLKDTKTGDDRYVQMNEATRTLLAEHHAHRSEVLRRYTLRPIEPHNYVFSDWPDGHQPLSPAALSKRWQRHVLASGVNERVRLHDLRHWHVSTAVAASVPISIVAESAGHSPTTLLRIYAHAPRGDSRAVDAASDALGL